MRVKESSDDYRYFPEPDLPPLHVDAAWLAGIRERLPELPAARRERYGELGLSAYDAAVIVDDPRASELFEALVADGVAPKDAANWVSGEYLRLLRKYGEGDVVHVEAAALGPELAHLIRLVAADQITRTNAKEVFETHFVSRAPVAAIIDEHRYRKISDTGAIEAAVEEALAANPQAVGDFRAGRQQAVGFLVGQVMKATRGQANAALVQAAVRERLERGGEG
jgi:aspartyl-tRNA(Asn)/glutamyl-tRNA(Gln) amidotransferase subunit B